MTDSNFFEAAPSSKLEFSGVFSNETRKRFRCKRLQLGLSFESVGEFFGVNWSTVRKWEQGPTRTCSGFFVRKIQRFITGEYDRMLNEKNRYGGNPGYYSRQMPEIVSQCSEKIANTYMLCKRHPDLRKELMDNVVAVTNSVLTSLTSKPSDDSENQEDADLFE